MAWLTPQLSPANGTDGLPMPLSRTALKRTPVRITETVYAVSVFIIGVLLLATTV